MKLLGLAIVAVAFAYCAAVVWAVGKMDAAGFNFRGEW